MKVKVKLNNKGNLFIERAGKFKIQGCPYYHKEAACGDWCPLFVECEGCLELCESTICYDEMIDERKKDDGPREQCEHGVALSRDCMLCGRINGAL